APADPGARADVRQQGAEVERHDAAAGADRAAAALEHPQQLLVRAPVRLLPERLDARALQRLVGDVPGDVAQAARSRAGQALELLRQRVAQLALHVDVRVELVDE